MFHPEGLDPRPPYGSSPDVLDPSGLGATPASAVVHAIIHGFYDARVAGSVPRTL